MSSPNTASPAGQPRLRPPPVAPLDAGARRRQATLTLALLAGLGALLVWLGSFDQERLVGPIVFRETAPGRDEPRSIHLAATLIGPDRDRLRLDAIFTRTPIDVDFRLSRIVFPDGRQVSFPRGGTVILVDGAGAVRRRTFEPGGLERRWVVDLFTRELVGSPESVDGSEQYRPPATFDEVRQGFAQISPELESFWTDP